MSKEYFARLKSNLLKTHLETYINIIKRLGVPFRFIMCLGEKGDMRFFC
jgi:hypothetical protein